MDDRFVWFNFNAEFSSLYKAFGGYYNGNTYCKKQQIHSNPKFQLRNCCNANGHCGHPYMSSIGSALVVIIEIRLFRVPQRDMDTVRVVAIDL
jgi:hypothetical protein